MTATNVKVATNGLCYLAPLGTTLPTAYDDTLDAAFIDLGEISEDGLERAFETSSEAVRNWRRQPIRNLTTEVTATFKLTFLETNEATVNAYFGGTVATNVAGGSAITVGQPSNVQQSLVLALEDSAYSETSLVVVPRAVATEREAITDSAGEVTGYGVTFMAYYDETVDGLFEVYFPTDLTSA